MALNCIKEHYPSLEAEYNNLINQGLLEKEALATIVVQEIEKLNDELNKLKEEVGQSVDELLIPKEYEDVKNLRSYLETDDTLFKIIEENIDTFSTETNDIRFRIIGEKEEGANKTEDIKKTNNFLEKIFNPDFKNTIVERLSKFDEQIDNRKYPSALEVAEHVLPRVVFNKYKSLYELAAKNNITVAYAQIPFGTSAAWGQGSILLNKNTTKTVTRDYNEFAETLNHEIIHGLISRGIKDDYKLYNDLQGVMEKVLENYDSASDEIKSIISYIQDTRKEFVEQDILGATDEEMSSEKFREIGSLEELITYAFTNKNFADFLDSLPSSTNIDVEGRSIFQQLKDIIRNFITTLTPTALDEIDYVVNKYFDTSWNEKQIAERNNIYQWGLRFEARENVFDSYNNDPKKIQEAYFRGKKDNLNTELVTAVEELLERASLEEKENFLKEDNIQERTVGQEVTDEEIDELISQGVITYTDENKLSCGI